MKGTVVGTWVDTLGRIYPKEHIEELMKQAGMANKSISPLDDIEDRKVFAFMQLVSKHYAIAPDQLWKMIGQDNIQSFYQGYPSFFKKKNLYHFLSSMNDVHQVVRKRIAGSNPPVLDMEIIAPKAARLTYRSPRGMFPYLQGLLQGAAEHFKEEITIQEQTRGKEEMQLILTFAYPLIQDKRYQGSLALSLGFLRDIALKSAWPVLLVGFVCAFLTRQSPGLFWVSPLLASATAFGAVKLVSLPAAAIDQENTALLQKNYQIKTRIHSGGDLFEQIHGGFNRYKAVIAEEFIGFNSMTEEMQNFSESLGGISKEMSATSQDIAQVVDQLSMAASNQAQETENSVSLLQTNVESIQKISQEESQNKQELEQCLENTQASFSRLEATIASLEEMMQSFAALTKDSLQLRTSGQEIQGIASFVSSLSYQTNLLALNAAIEASQAGESGKGFAVVAQEVRRLATQTETAAQNIKENLFSFLGQMDQMVERIGGQYQVIQQERSSIQAAIEQTEQSNVRIAKVAAAMVGSIEQLQEQSTTISSIFGNIESLAAIAEQNSASTDVVSDNVANYAQEIQKLTEGIGDFQKLTDEFKRYIATSVL